MPPFSNRDRDAIRAAIAIGSQPAETQRQGGVTLRLQTPAGPGRRAATKVLVSNTGELTASGQFYYQELQHAPPDRSFDHTQEHHLAPRGRSQRIWLRDGAEATIATRQRNGQWRATPLGTKYFAHKESRWVVSLPVTRFLKRDRGRTSYWEKGRDWVVSTAIPDLGEFVFPANMSEEDQRHAIEARVQAWLEARPRQPIVERDAIDAPELDDQPPDEGILINEADYDPAYYDPRGTPEVSRMTVAEGTLSAAVNRPLNSLRPWHFAGQQFADEAYEVTDRNCIVHQLCELVRVRGQPFFNEEDVRGPSPSCRRSSTQTTATTTTPTSTPVVPSRGERWASQARCSWSSASGTACL
jgi:hypothetical protein